MVDDNARRQAYHGYLVVATVHRSQRPFVIGRRAVTGCELQKKSKMVPAHQKKYNNTYSTSFIAVIDSRA
jgi:hypothetical protein